MTISERKHEEKNQLENHCDRLKGNAPVFMIDHVIFCSIKTFICFQFRAFRFSLNLAQSRNETTVLMSTHNEIR